MYEAEAPEGAIAGNEPTAVDEEDEEALLQAALAISMQGVSPPDAASAPEAESAATTV